MRLDSAARELIGAGTEATLVTLNPDGSPHVTVVWVALQSAPEGDELVAAHLAEHKKVRNIRADGRVALTIISAERGPMTPYLAVGGTARIDEGGAPELLSALAKAVVSPDAEFPPPGSPPGFLTRVLIDKIGGSVPGPSNQHHGGSQGQASSTLTDRWQRSARTRQH